jgi:phage shock protein C
MNKKLYRDEYHKVIGGVCSGLADYFDMDVTVIRLLFAFSVIIMGVGFIPYIILWIVLPRKDYTFNSYNNPTVDYTVPPQQPAGQFNPPPPQPGSSFGSAPFTGNPITMPPKQKSNAGIIVGAVLIILGAAILIDEFDLIPDFDFERLWPGILILIGAAIIVSGQKTHPWDKQDWHTGDKKDNSSNDNPPAAGNTEADNTLTKES